MRKILQLKKDKNIIGAIIFCIAGLSGLNSVIAAPIPNKNTDKSSQKLVLDKNTVVLYTGDTFEKIKSSGKIIIGYRSGSVPISYYDQNKKPIGYGIDICLDIVEKIKTTVNMPNLNVEYVEVNADTRIPAIISGKIDMECGSTTNNAIRRKEVAFSIPYYIAGVRILAKKDSGITGLNDLRGKTIVFNKGTTSVDLMKKFDKQRVMHINIKEESGSTAALNAVATGKAQAFILDDLLLFGEKSQANNPQDFIVVGDFLSVEPLAIILRKNDIKFKDFVNSQMYSIINSGKIEEYYLKWFQNPIPPKNQNLNIPQSSLLRDNFRLPTDIVGN